MPRSIERTKQAFREHDAREWEPTYRAAEYVAEARERMGEETWRKLNQEWNND